MNTTRSYLDALHVRQNHSGGERTPSDSSKIDELGQKVRQLAAEISGSGPAQTAGRLNERDDSVSNNIIAEINARKRMLNNESNIPSSTDTSPSMAASIEARLDSQANILSSGLSDLGDRIEKLRQEIGRESSGIHSTVVNRPQTVSSAEKLDHIANGIRELEQAPRFNPSAFDALHNELDNLRLSLGGSVQRKEFSKGITDGINESVSTPTTNIKDRLDAYAANSASLNADVLAAQIDTLSEAVNNLSESMALDQRLQTLVDAIDALAKNSQSMPSIEPGLEAIENRLDEITRAIVAVSAKSQDGSKSNPTVLERLENHVAELSRGVNLTTQREEDDQFTHVAKRIENLSRQLEMLARSRRGVKNAA